jgi:hypothetical protein
VARVSLGIGNSKEEVDTLIRALNQITGKFRTTDELLSNSENKHTLCLTKAQVKKQMDIFASEVALNVYK